MHFYTVDVLKREIRIHKSLNHENIVKLIFYCEDKKNVYLIMEYAENGSLFRYIHRKKLTESQVFKFFFQTCLGIDYLHKNKIIHRDLKPENLLLDQQINVKLCDFGWSAESSDSVKKRLTFCGTCEYMAPEMIRNEGHDQMLDIWTLGILLYELLQGHAPYRGKNDHEICQNIINQVPYTFKETVSLEVTFRNIIMLFIGQKLNQFNSETKSKRPITNEVDFQTSLDDQKCIAEQYKYSRLCTQQVRSPKPIIQQSTPINYASMDQQQAKTRVSYKSKRNEQVHQQNQQHRAQSSDQKQDIGFLDKMLISLGCMKRENRHGHQ